MKTEEIEIYTISDRSDGKFQARFDHYRRTFFSRKFVSLTKSEWFDDEKDCTAWIVEHAEKREPLRILRTRRFNAQGGADDCGGW